MLAECKPCGKALGDTLLGEAFAMTATSRTMTKQRFAIRVETHDVSVVRRANAAIDIWCEACAAQVPMFLPERVAALIETTPREIYRRVEAGELHFVETDSGELLICSASLRQIRDRSGQCHAKHGLRFVRR
jgi:hypothetical protein